jgi:hypothetical protein
MFGEYLDAFPGRWLVWNGGGPLGPRRYACRKHRGDLVAYLRYHYATVAAQVWKMPPYEQRWPDERRPHMGGSMGIIKFGLRGGLLQDSAPGTAAAEQAAPGEPALPDLDAPGDLFPPEDLLPPELGPSDDELFPPGELMFPPGELFPPDDLPPPDDDPRGDEGQWPPPGFGDDPPGPEAPPPA